LLQHPQPQPIQRTKCNRPQPLPTPTATTSASTARCWRCSRTSPARPRCPWSGCWRRRPCCSRATSQSAARLWWVALVWFGVGVGLVGADHGFQVHVVYFAWDYAYASSQQAPVPISRPLPPQPKQNLAAPPQAHPGRAHVTAAVVRYLTPFKRQKRGLVTTWLAGLKPAAAAAADEASSAGAAGCGRAPVWVERGCLRMPPSLAAPLLLVGPGTGVAPFRSFLWQRAALIQRQQQQQQQEGGPAEGAAAAAIAPCVLFFGCRHPDKDFYYSSDWAELQAIGALDPHWGVVVAFSRPGDGGGGSDAAAAGADMRKQYVTDKIKQHGEQVGGAIALGVLMSVLALLITPPRVPQKGFLYVLPHLNNKHKPSSHHPPTYAPHPLRSGSSSPSATRASTSRGRPRRCRPTWRLRWRP